MVIGKNIRYLRLRHGMSQSDLANKLGYKSFTTIQKWESDVSTPPLEIFIKMSELFDVDIDEFARKDLSAKYDADGSRHSDELSLDVAEKPSFSKYDDEKNDAS